VWRIGHRHSQVPSPICTSLATPSECKKIPCFCFSTLASFFLHKPHWQKAFIPNFISSAIPPYLSQPNSLSLRKLIELRARFLRLRKFLYQTFRMIETSELALIPFTRKRLFEYLRECTFSCKAIFTGFYSPLLIGFSGVCNLSFGKYMLRWSKPASLAMLVNNLSDILHLLHFSIFCGWSLLVLQSVNGQSSGESLKICTIISYAFFSNIFCMRTKKSSNSCKRRSHHIFIESLPIQSRSFKL